MTTAGLPVEGLAAAVRAVQAGGVVAVPTDRWYMLAVLATDRAAGERLYRMKGRDRSKSLLLNLPAGPVPAWFVRRDAADRLISAFWPGDLTLLLPWRSPDQRLHAPLVGDPALVGCAAGVLGALTAEVGAPLATTSANRSTLGPEDPGPSVSPRQLAVFASRSGDRLDAWIDGGICPLAVHASTVDATGERPRLVRAGTTHVRALAEVVDLEPGDLRSGGAVDRADAEVGEVDGG